MRRSSSSGGTSYSGSSYHDSSSSNPMTYWPSDATLTRYGGVIIVLFIFGLGYLYMRVGRRPSVTPLNIVEAADHDLAVILIGIGDEARLKLQSRLEFLSTQPQDSDHGRQRVLQSIIAALNDVRDQWAFLGAYDDEPMPYDIAMERLDARVAQLRERYRKDLLVARDGAVLNDQRAHTEASATGYAVVTLLVAARKSLENVERDVNGIPRVLHALSSLAAEDIGGYEVVWSPSDPSESMTSAQIEAVYPELTRLNRGVGGVACAYCGTVYAAERPACPRCGGARA